MVDQGDPRTEKRVAYVAENLAALRLEGEPRFFGHCEIYASKDVVFEEGPGWDNVDDALAWARKRAPVVILRIGSDEQQIYSAGDRDPTDEPLPRWPGPTPS
jgi:hypothetical protein